MSNEEAGAPDQAQTSAVPTLTPEQEFQLDLHGVGSDWFLRTLVNIVNGGELQFGVTLLSEGVVVSGVLIGGATYFKLWAKEFADAVPGDSEGKAEVEAAFAQHADTYGPERSADGPPVEYIHLRDARFCAPGQNPMPSNRGVLWRGRLNAVSGFTLGQLNASSV